MSLPILYYTNQSGDNAWENLTNWNTASDNTGDTPTEIPWTCADNSTSGYDLVDATNGAGVTINSIINPTGSDISGKLLIPSVINNSTINIPYLQLSGTSVNNGTITGVTVLYNNSYNAGSIEDNVTLYDNSYNDSYGYIFGAGHFHNASYNLGQIYGYYYENEWDALSNFKNIPVFWDESYNSGTINVNATFHDNSINEVSGIVYVNGYMHENSINRGTIYSIAWFNQNSRNEGYVGVGHSVQG
jgi:hypothetical protein